MNTQTMSSKRLLVWLAGITGVLLIPMIAMQFTQEVSWKTGDFVIAGVLLACVALIYELVVRRFSSKTKRIVFSLILLLALALIWAELAVGIFGTSFAGS